MFKNLKNTTHTVKHEVAIKLDVDPQTKLFVKAVCTIIVVNAAAHIVNTVVDQKFKN
jgi:hypothetical protein